MRDLFIRERGELSQAGAAVGDHRLSDVTLDDVNAFVGSLARYDTAWSRGCADLIQKLWADRCALLDDRRPSAL
jgi:hypothetical protein